MVTISDSTGARHDKDGNCERVRGLKHVAAAETYGLDANDSQVDP